MANKKWRRPTKKEVKAGIQFFLMGYGVCSGFISTYLTILVDLGLTNGALALVLASILGAASCFGLFEWISRS